MKSFRTAFAAFALVVALIGVSTLPVYAGHERSNCAPAAAAHGCCKAPILKACCSERSDTSSQGGPIESRVYVNPNLTGAPAIFTIDLSSGPASLVRPQSTPPRTGSLDLPTLLSTLLI